MILILCAIPVITDKFGVGSNTQYAYNAVYLLLILPAGIALSGIIEKLHPEYFKDDGRGNA